MQFVLERPLLGNNVVGAMGYLGFAWTILSFPWVTMGWQAVVELVTGATEVRVSIVGEVNAAGGEVAGMAEQSDAEVIAVEREGARGNQVWWKCHCWGISQEWWREEIPA